MRVCVGILCAVLSGCWHTLVTDGTVSTRDIDFGNQDKVYYIDYSRRIRGTDRQHIISFITFNNNPRAEGAIDNAIDSDVSFGSAEDRRYVGLVSAKVRYCWFYIPYVYGQAWYSAEGYPICEITRKPTRELSVTSEIPTEVRMKNHDSEQIKPPPAKESKGGFDDFPF